MENKYLIEKLLNSDCNNCDGAGNSMDELNDESKTCTNMESPSSDNYDSDKTDIIVKSCPILLDHTYHINPPLDISQPVILESDKNKNNESLNTDKADNMENLCTNRNLLEHDYLEYPLSALCQPTSAEDSDSHANRTKQSNDKNFNVSSETLRVVSLENLLPETQAENKQVIVSDITNKIEKKSERDTENVNSDICKESVSHCTQNITENNNALENTSKKSEEVSESNGRCCDESFEDSDATMINESKEGSEEDSNNDQVKNKCINNEDKRPTGTSSDDMDIERNLNSGVNRNIGLFSDSEKTDDIIDISMDTDISATDSDSTESYLFDVKAIGNFFLFLSTV